MVKVTFFGAAGMVTGSNHLIETDNHRFVVDCGLFQGMGLAEHNHEPFGYAAEEVEAVIITHAHLDHIGRLPMLVKEGFAGPIYATQATIDLMHLALADACGLMIEKAERHGPPPLYDEADLNKTLSLCRAVDYHQTVQLTPKVSLTLYDAGHILGSAIVLLELEGKRLVFSGDLGFFSDTLLAKPEMPKQADLVVMEATYGNRNHPDQPGRHQILKDAFGWTARRRGVLLIPAFAIERTQELLLLLNELHDQGELPKIPIFLDSPLAIEALEVFKHYKKLYLKRIQEEIEQKPNHDVFAFERLILTSAVEQSKAIAHQPPPKAIIAGSGMMEGGRIVHHLKHHLGQPSTYLLIIGYQAQGTLGSRILSGAASIQIMGEQIPIRAKVVNCPTFSSHADHKGLIDWLKHVEVKAEGQVVIVHSDSDQALAFHNSLHQSWPELKSTIAKFGQTVSL